MRLTNCLSLYNIIVASRGVGRYIRVSEAEKCSGENGMLRKYRIHKYHDYYLVDEPQHLECSLLCGSLYENR